MGCGDTEINNGAQIRALPSDSLYSQLPGIKNNYEVVPQAIATTTIVEKNQIFVNYICVEIGKLRKLPHGNRSVTTIVETRYMLYV